MKRILLILTMLMLCVTVFGRGGHQCYTVLYPSWYKIIAISYVEGFGYGSRGVFDSKTLMRIAVHYQIKGEDIFQMIAIEDWDREQDPIVSFEKSEDVRDFELQSQMSLQMN